jgi:DNA-binding transcriptional ArsR family regulator
MLNHHDPLDRVFHALADPTRRSIVERLTRAAASVSELAQPLDMSLAGVMQHLQVLEESGLIRTAKAGRVRNCRIEWQTLNAAENWIAQRRSVWERHLDRLGEVLKEQSKSLSRETKKS